MFDKVAYRKSRKSNKNFVKLGFIKCRL